MVILLDKTALVKGNDNSDDNDTETRTPRVKKRTEKEKMADLME